MAHHLVGQLVIQQANCFGDYGLVTGADQAYGASFDGGRALCGIAHAEHWLAQGGRLFLNATGVGQDQVALLHQVDERQIILRLDQVHVVEPLEVAIDRLLHIGVEVHRIDDLHVIPLGQHRQRLADALETITMVLTAVAGYQDQLLALVKEGEAGSQLYFHAHVLVDAMGYLDQGVDHRVTSDEDGLGGDVFHDEVFQRTDGRGVVLVGNPPGQAAHPLFRPGRVDIAGAQAGFNVTHRDAVIVGRQGRGKGGGGVTVYQNAIRLELGKHRFQPLQDGGGDIGQILSRLHDVEVIVRLDLEQIEHLVQHLSVLSCDTDSDIHLAIGLEGLDDWGHLDCFRPCPKYHQYPLRFHRHNSHSRVN
ncbi:hypothetical protein D3C80_706490 [compost metagenome]